MKKNYKQIFDEEIELVKKAEKKPTLLLHACCAPCSSAVIERLNDIFDITLFFYNPNIYPKSEFDFRLDELKRLIEEMNFSNITILSPDYDNSEFERIARGYEDIPEGGVRCKQCYRLRLERSVAFAAENNFDYVTTTLSISPYKNATLLNEIGIELGKRYGIKYLCSDFKKNDGYKRSCQLSGIYNLYRQNYCGCIYSKNFADKKEHSV